MGLHRQGVRGSLVSPLMASQILTEWNGDHFNLNIFRRQSSRYFIPMFMALDALILGAKQSHG